MSRYLVTGAAGFIGYHLASRLLSEGHSVVGLDNLNGYYSVDLKKSRLEELNKHGTFSFHWCDISDKEELGNAFKVASFDAVAHLAAQAGVRYSIINPDAYIQSNLVGFGNILECCRDHGLPPLVYASSSSVYGANQKMPWRVSDNVDHPVSLYAATKKSNELMAHTYAHLYGLPCTGLRFFTVYGAWGRPDMAYFKFTKAILKGEPIEVYNYGNMKRDFTYVDDVVESIARLLNHPAMGDPNWNRLSPDPSTSAAPYRLYNIGNSTPVSLLDFISTLECLLKVKAELALMPMQMGDVEATFADVDALREAVGFSPSTSLESGLAKFTDWYKDYYGL